MATDILMPNLGFDSQSGRVLEWYKQPGDTVNKGESIALVEADKSNVELESIASGVLLEILIPLDAEIAIGTVIARIGASEELAKPSPAGPVAVRVESVDDAGTSDNNDTVSAKVSPLARKIADEHNINLDLITGTGARGRIMRQDVEAYLDVGSGAVELLPRALPKVRKAAREAGIKLVDLDILDRPITTTDLKAYTSKQQAPTAVAKEIPAVAVSHVQPAPRSVPEGASEIPLSRMRKRIGERLVNSKQSAPHFYVTGEFDLTEAIARLSTYKAKINDLLQYLTVQALLQVPGLNGHFDGEKLYTFEHVHLAIAVALDTGLITPVIANADHYSLNGLAQQSRDLIKRTREGQLTPQDMQQGTFTISNMGVIRQVEQFTAIINPPQLAILAIGSVKPRPVIVDGGFHARETVHLTLSGDHRVVDGIHLARFMEAFQTEIDRFSQQ